MKCSSFGPALDVRTSPAEPDERTLVFSSNLTFSNFKISSGSKSLSLLSDFQSNGSLPTDCKSAANSSEAGGVTDAGRRRSGRDKSWTHHRLALPHQQVLYCAPLVARHNASPPIAAAESSYLGL